VSILNKDESVTLSSASPGGDSVATFLPSQILIRGRGRVEDEPVRDDGGHLKRNVHQASA